jgi:hypothetical protein
MKKRYVMKKIVQTLFIAALMSPTLVSCVRGPEIEPVPPFEDEPLFNVAMSLPQEMFVPGTKTRTLDFTSENAIDNVYVLVFDNTNVLRAIRMSENLRPNPGPDPTYTPGIPYSATWAFNVKMEATGSNTCKIVALANCAAILSATIGTDNSSSAIGQTYDAVIGQIYDGITTAMYPGTNTGRFPMWGETAQISVAPGQNAQTVDMVRAVARIDVGVGTPTWNATNKGYTWSGTDSNGATIPFVLSSVVVARPNNRYQVIPSASNHNGTTVNTPTVPAGTTAFSVADSKTNFTFNAASNAVTYTIYTPEADVLMGLTGTSGDTNHTNRMAVIVGGSYNGGATTYYRLDFANNGALMNVLRNHLYQFNITRVTGPGVGTVDDAYVAAAANMNATVMNWDQSSMNRIVFDGKNSLSVTRDTVKLYSNQYTAISPIRDNEEIIWTDVPAGWTVDRIVDAANVPVTWASVSPTTGPANTRTSQTVSVSQNNTGVARNAYMWLAAGGLRYNVVINQSEQAALDLRVRRTVNGSLQDVSQLTFTAPANAAPAAQSFQLDWLPATNPVNVAATQTQLYEFPNPGSNPAVNDGAPYQNQQIQVNNGTYTYTVTPPAITSAEVATNPFIKKESRFDFTVGNGYTNMTRSITLTQIVPTLRVEPDPFVAPYFPMDGRQYSYNVRSNVNWRISNIVETPRVTTAGMTPLIAAHTGTDNVYTGATGTPNYTPGGGFRELLTTNGQAKGNSGWADVTYTAANAGDFPDVTRRLFFPAAPFVVYGIAAMPPGTNANFANYYSGNNGTPTGPSATNDIHTMAISAVNFGTTLSGPAGAGQTPTPTSTVFVPQIFVRGYQNNGSYTIPTQAILDAAATNPDMLVISGSNNFTRQTADAIRDNFLSKGKVVFMCCEDVPTILNMIQSVGFTGTIYWGNSATNGTAPVYWFQNNPGDPLVSGPFMTNGGQPLSGNAYWGEDEGGAAPMWFTDKTQLISYSNAENQSGNTDAPPTGLPQGENMSTGTTLFRWRSVPLIIATDGGFLSSQSTGSNYQSPSLVDNNTKRPMGKGNYGTGTTRREVSNAIFVANVTAWAIQRRTNQ